MPFEQRIIRHEKRLARQIMPATERALYSEAIVETLLADEDFLRATHIGAFLPMPEEVDISLIFKNIWEMGKKLYLPVTLDKNQPLAFAPYVEHSRMNKDIAGIAYPDVPISQFEYPASRHCALQYVITPLVAFDRNCGRIGMGGGFYDRSFFYKLTDPTQSPLLVGVAFSVQETEAVSKTPWDVPLDKVVTEDDVFVRSSAA